MDQPNHLQRGLTPDEVIRSRQEHGDNVFTPPATTSMWRKLLLKFSDSLIIVLLVAGVLSIGISFYEYFGLHHGASVFFEPIGIFVAIILATGLALIFEEQAEKEFAILNRVNDDETVKVLRDGNITTVPRRDVVVGDVVILSTGDEVPADGRLTEAMHLSVDESTLTGEPVCAKTTVEADFDPDATYPSDHVMRGTKVVEGHGVMVVERVGDATDAGRVFTEARIDNSVRTPLNEQLDRLARLISTASYIVAGAIITGRLIQFFHDARACLLAIPVAIFFWLVIKRFGRWRPRTNVMVILAFIALFIGCILWLWEMVAPGQNVGPLLSYTLQTIMVAVTLIVVSVPEGLPMAVTLSLAYSMRQMLKTNNLVRRMHACETMGAATVICTDKTGTLTRNRMQVAEVEFFDTPRDLAHAMVAINSTAELDRTGATPAVVGNPTEGALLLWLDSEGDDYAALRHRAVILAELPFSTERKYMATVARTGADSPAWLLIKGAPEIVLDMCTYPAAGVTDEEIRAQLARFQSQGMRTLAFAAAQLPADQQPHTADDITALIASHTLPLRPAGIVAIADPVRDDVPAAVRECRDAGIAIKIVTGDTPATAREIARQIGLWDDADGVANEITGTEFAALSDDEVLARCRDLKIISRARPMDKKRLVEALQQLGEVVAVTGDGTNDAPALKAAHVGLSMGDGTSVAKEASDITIVDNSFASIGRAVMWGRSLYRNIQRFVLFQLTVNVVACLIVMAGAFLGTDSPLTVTQMLWVNLIMDTFAAMALASLPPSMSVMKEKPRDRRRSIITPQMTRFIVAVGLIFFGVLFAFLYFLEYHTIASLREIAQATYHSTPAIHDYELSLFFTFFVMLQFWNLFNAKAFGAHRSAFHFAHCRGFLWIVLIIFVGQVLIVQFGGELFSVRPLRLSDWLIIVGSTSLVLWLGELLRALPRR